MPELLYREKKDCCGCEACASICPKNIIELSPDSEGFIFPKVSKSEECINCGQCIKVCPLKNTSNVNDFHEKTIAGYSKKQNEIRASASGSLGTAIAKGIINQGGVVYGVAYTEDYLSVEYQRASTIESLEQFRTSKYVQARKNEIYKQVRKDLNDGEKVLFIGLPCEINALKLFLVKDYSNLFTCSLICHGPTSLQVHVQYLQNNVIRKDAKIKEFSVRFKKYGWKPYYIRALYDDETEYSEKFSESCYGISFLYLKRLSCNSCKIKREKIHSDITIGDYHYASEGNTSPYNPDGVSSAFVHTNKGEYLLSIADDFFYEIIPLKNALYSEAYYKAIPARDNREEFGKIFSTQGIEAACRLKSVLAIERKLKRRLWIRKQGAKIKKKLLAWR